MPLQWIPDPDPRLVRFKATAPPPTLDEIEAKLGELGVSRSTGWDGLVLNDATDFPAPSAEYMRAIIPAFSVMAKRAGIRRYAVLTSNIAMYGMGRMASFLAEPVLELEAFDDEREAREWLLRK
jgi:hypothetical protein